jgi:hypothetical protein
MTFLSWHDLSSLHALINFINETGGADKPSIRHTTQNAMWYVDGRFAPLIFIDEGSGCGKAGFGY